MFSVFVTKDIKFGLSVNVLWNSQTRPCLTLKSAYKIQQARYLKIAVLYVTAQSLMAWVAGKLSLSIFGKRFRLSEWGPKFSGIYLSENVNFSPTYFTISLNLFSTSCTHFHCFLLYFFPNFNFGWIALFPYPKSRKFARIYTQVQTCYLFAIYFLHKGFVFCCRTGLSIYFNPERVSL